MRSLASSRSWRSRTHPIGQILQGNVRALGLSLRWINHAFLDCRAQRHKLFYRSDMSRIGRKCGVGEFRKEYLIMTSEFVHLYVFAHVSRVCTSSRHGDDAIHHVLHAKRAPWFELDVVCRRHDGNVRLFSKLFELFFGETPDRLFHFKTMHTKKDRRATRVPLITPKNFWCY